MIFARIAWVGSLPSSLPEPVAALHTSEKTNVHSSGKELVEIFIDDYVTENERAVCLFHLQRYGRDEFRVTVFQVFQVKIFSSRFQKSHKNSSTKVKNYAKQTWTSTMLDS